MGPIHATAIIRHPADRDRFWEGTFLANTGAIDCIVPRPILESVGLSPMAERVYTMEDGSQVSMEHTTGEVEILGRIAGATIVFTDDDDAVPLLGSTVMYSAGVEVDPQSGQLKLLPSISLR